MNNDFPKPKVYEYIDSYLNKHKVDKQSKELISTAINVIMIYILTKVSHTTKQNEIRQANDKIISHLDIDKKVQNIMHLVEGDFLEIEVSFEDTIYDTYMYVNEGGSISKNLITRIDSVLNYYLTKLLGSIKKNTKKYVNRSNTSKSIEQIFPEEIISMIVKVEDNDEEDEDIFEKSDNFSPQVNDYRESVRTEDVFDTRLSIDTDIQKNKKSSGTFESLRLREKKIKNMDPILDIVAFQSIYK